MNKLTTNENILFQVAFKEACIELRTKDSSEILTRSLDLYDNVLVKGLQALEIAKNAQVATNKDLKSLIAAAKKAKDLGVFRNENLASLQALKGEERETMLKEFKKLGGTKWV